MVHLQHEYLVQVAVKWTSSAVTLWKRRQGGKHRDVTRVLSCACFPDSPIKSSFANKKGLETWGKCQWLCRIISFEIFEQNKHMIIIDNMCMIDGSFRVDGRAIHFCCHWLRKLASNFRIILIYRPTGPSSLVHATHAFLLSCKGCKWNLASTFRYRVVHSPYARSAESLTKFTHIKVLQLLAYLQPMYHPSKSCSSHCCWMESTNRSLKLAGEKKKTHP